MMIPNDEHTFQGGVPWTPRAERMPCLEVAVALGVSKMCPTGEPKTTPKMVGQLLQGYFGYTF